MAASPQDAKSGAAPELKVAPKLELSKTPVFIKRRLAKGRGLHYFFLHDLMIKKGFAV